ncbi:MAG: carboxylating nicotinate-nucleotide diphosphorylase [Gammaproteobacteria bacterium]|nr:carboxylating nicotinate-nucleotide diphosphorylase [Gammaproteobacteria bacterium]MDH3847545.1 carboxylating nicotinate-nucleotide diphosphorylase [Gammaproteobacteria bacterium]MDH3862801.1 carboxylating nicotinate-nucleotide diphosphorylase [Gammaproteobacteria bacterium]MDH3905469.1 carboxylating nicotinate-nucleotide diphosphorylase [Gammaproteobacteria bacterium]MDH3907849.1 carboxylating nicotinate-nucleotide diphosphorylase [Gammaproteobacteria bacterium]
MFTDELQSVVHKNVADALAEDVGSGDLTAGLIGEDEILGASIIARESLVLAGHPWANEVYRQLDERVQVDWYVEDSQGAEADDIICKLVGPARALLTGERTALNFLQTLSATATTTAAFVAAAAGTRAKVLDTRKTLPGLRQAQKYAVRCGGGHNHRSGLYDAILIKENHIKSAGSITEALRRAKAADSAVLIEVEVESLDELREALDAGAERILLDNFAIPELREAVSINATYGYVAAELEASGNVCLETIREIAETGVDYISTGAITKNVRAIDLSMLFRID